jgi:hypothetical protein
MDSSDGLCGGSVCVELPAFNLFCNIAMYCSRMLEDSAAVYCRHHGVHNQVATFRDEVEDNHIPWFGL